jgi:hypothetical protein
MASKMFKSGSISMGIAPNDALSWRGDWYRNQAQQRGEKIVSEKGI